MQSSEFARHLEAAGVVDDLSTVRRVVVDAVAGEPVMVYIVRFGDERLLDVDWGGLVPEPIVEVADPLLGSGVSLP
jgi:hypothetical protein